MKFLMKLLMKQGRSGGSFRLPYWIGVGLTILASVLFLLPQQAAAAAIEQPCRFYGTVKVNGNWVTNGTLITAWIDSVTGSWTTNASIYDGQSVYVLDVPASSPGESGGTGGDIVRFKVRDGSTDYQAAQTGVWKLGDFVPVNLAVNTTTPVAQLKGQPTGTVNYRTANITVGGTSVVAYKYKLDNGTWNAETLVSTNITLSNLTEGEHTVYVIGKDSGGWQPDDLPTTASWTVDTTFPTATLSGQPSGVVNYNTANITVGGANVVSYKYKLDNATADWGNEDERLVGSNITLSNLPDGLHTVYVIGKNAAGTWQPFDSPTTVNWTVDTTLPTATLSGQPSGVVSYNTANIAVGGVNVVAYKYKLDNDDWGAEIPVANNITLSNLPDGLHTVSVIAKNAHDHWQADATTVDWTVDTTAPAVPVLTSPGNGTAMSDNTPSLDWANVTDPSGVSYSLQIDNSSDFSSPEVDVIGLASISYTSAALADGTYYWRVRAVDGATPPNEGSWSAVWSFTVDITAPPVPTLLSPANEAKIGDSTPELKWSNVTDPNGVKYSLQVDNDTDFSSPIISKEELDESTYAITGDEALTKGNYYWRVKAIDGVGNESNWTTTFSFTITKSEVGGCGCSCSQVEASTGELLVGWGIVGFCCSTGYYFLRRASKRKKQ